MVPDIIERYRVLKLTRAARRIAPLGHWGIRNEREAPTERGEKLGRLWGRGCRNAEGGERGAVSGGDGRVQGVDVGHLELTKYGGYLIENEGEIEGLGFVQLMRRHPSMSS